MPRSIYVFRTEQDYNDAKEHIRSKMYYDWYYSDRISFYGYWGICYRFDWSDCWRIDIEDNCSDPALAASIFREHDGRFYAD